ncbi:MAG: HEAT repeat domain-containing protein [Armatimonadota bacterium]|nr:HEAT repeat domain-containing protein [Armatimonadota bacterium]
MLLAILAPAVLSATAVFSQQSPPEAGEQFRRQLSALAEIKASENLTAEEKAGTVMAALESEVREPLDRPGTPALASGYALTEHLRIAYVSVLGELLLPDALWQRRAAIPTGDEAKATDTTLRRLLLFAFATSAAKHEDAAIAEARRQRAIEQLTRLLRTDEDDLIRALAARSLGFLDTREAKPALAEALNDPAFRDVEGLTDIGAPGWGSRQYLVRLEAALALRRMGFAIRHPSHDVWLLEE